MVVISSPKVEKALNHWRTGEYAVTPLIDDGRRTIGFVWSDAYGWNARTWYQTVGRSVADGLNTRERAVLRLLRYFEQHPESPTG